MTVHTKKVLFESEVYEYYTESARIFYLNDEGEFSDFIRDSVQRSDDGQTMDQIENGRITLSASLQKSLRSVFSNKDFFAPMERQKNSYERS